MTYDNFVHDDELLLELLLWLVVELTELELDDVFEATVLDDELTVLSDDALDALEAELLELAEDDESKSSPVLRSYCLLLPPLTVKISL
jgi:hypothetical protein